MRTSKRGLRFTTIATKLIYKPHITPPPEGGGLIKGDIMSVLYRYLEQQALLSIDRSVVHIETPDPAVVAAGREFSEIISSHNADVFTAAGIDEDGYMTEFACSHAQICFCDKFLLSEQGFIRENGGDGITVFELLALLKNRVAELTVDMQNTPKPAPLAPDMPELDFPIIGRWYGCTAEIPAGAELMFEQMGFCLYSQSPNVYASYNNQCFLITTPTDSPLLAHVGVTI